MATFELYRRSTVGMCLTETLDEMVLNGTLSPQIAIQVLVQFDKSMAEALETDVKSKVSIKTYYPNEYDKISDMPDLQTTMVLKVGNPVKWNHLISTIEVAGTSTYL